MVHSHHEVTGNPGWIHNFCSSADISLSAWLCISHCWSRQRTTELQMKFESNSFSFYLPVSLQQALGANPQACTGKGSPRVVEGWWKRPVGPKARLPNVTVNRRWFRDWQLLHWEHVFSVSFKFLGNSSARGNTFLVSHWVTVSGQGCSPPPKQLHS